MAAPETNEMTGDELRLIRTQAGLSQKELGVMIFTSGGAVHMYEKGKRPIPFYVQDIVEDIELENVVQEEEG